MENQILIVDDQELNRLIVIENLSEPLGPYNVIEAKNGQEALDILKIDNNFDLILLDIMMPILGGIETLQALKKSPVLKDIPVIMLTAKAAVSDITQALEMGASDYITKPFKIDELVARIDNLTALRRSQKEISEYLSLLESRSDMLQTLAEGAHDLGNILTSLSIIPIVIDEILDAVENTPNLKLPHLSTTIDANKNVSEKVDDALLLGTNILNSTMDLSIIGTIYPTLNYLEKIITQSLDFLSYRTKNIEFKISIMPEDICVFIVKDSWQRLFLNLFKNSIEAMKDCETRTLIIESYLSSNKTLIIEITDTGIGMKEKTLAKLKNDNVSTKKDGHGIGLAFVKKVVAQSNGTLTINSTYGKGSSFKLEFPENIIKK